MSRANRPIQNRIGDGRKIAPVIDKLKIELVIEEPNSGLLLNNLKLSSSPKGAELRISNGENSKLIFPSLGGSKSGLS